MANEDQPVVTDEPLKTISTTEVAGQPTAVGTQLETSFDALSPEQQAQSGGIEGFQSAVSEQQALTQPELGITGLNEDVAIGNVISNQEARQREAQATLSSDAGKEVVDKSLDDLDRAKLRQQEIADAKRDELTKDTVLPPGFEEWDEFAKQTYLDSVAASEQEKIDQIQRLTDYGANLDARSQEQIKQIQATFDRLEQQQRTANANRLGALEVIGTRTGRQRFAPELQEGILGAEEKAGIQALADLETKEQGLIMQAQAANDDAQFELLGRQMQLIKETRLEKEAAVDRLFGQMMNLEQLALQKTQEARAEKQFGLDLERFQEDVKNNDFNQAMSVAQNNGYRVQMEEGGEITILPQLTFENQLKSDQFALEVDKFGLDKTVATAQIEFMEKGYNLDVSKFNESVKQNGLNYALQEANLDLAMQDAALRKDAAGFGVTFDETNTPVPFANIESELGGVLSSVGTEVIGESGNLRPSATDKNGNNLGLTGWECAEYAEQLVDLGTPGNIMGDSYESKQATVDKYGVSANDVRTSPEGFKVGDVLITDGSDVGATNTKYGHAAVVVGKDAQGNLILQEANSMGDGAIRTGRKLNENDPAIYGILGRQNGNSFGNAGVKQKWANEATENAADQVMNNISRETINNAVDNGFIDQKQADAFHSAFEFTMSDDTSADKKDANRKILSGYLNSGDTVRAKDFVLKLALDAAPVKTKEQINGVNDAINKLETIQGLYKDFVDNGGDTGILVGNYQDMLNKLGKAGSEDLLNIQTKIRTAIIDYRQSKTGAQFSEAEMVEYEKLFPNNKKDVDFNATLINSLMGTFQDSQKVRLSSWMGATNYDALFNSNDTALQMDPSQDLVTDYTPSGWNVPTIDSTGRIRF